MGQAKIICGGCGTIVFDAKLVGAEGLEGNACVDACAELLVLVLELIELPIKSALGQQLLVRSALAELTFVHDKDSVGGLDGGETVRDEDRGAARDHAGEGKANA